jgi:hypothetical protein
METRGFRIEQIDRRSLTILRLQTKVLAVVSLWAHAMFATPRSATPRNAFVAHFVFAIPHRQGFT